MSNNKQEVYGFRFLDTLNQSFYQLFAVGNQSITKEAYHWNGLTRKDGPLFCSNIHSKAVVTLK